MSRMLKRITSIMLAAALLIPSAWIAPAAKAAEAAAPEIPVLLYHRVVANPTNEWTDTSVQKFRNTMQYLDDNGYTTITAEQYVAIKDGTAALEEIPAKPILLTFDDGTPDFVTNTLPILDEFNMNAVAFIVSGWIGGDYSMSTAQLEDIVANHPNVSIQNHTVNHADNTWDTLTQEAASAEIAEANTYLKGITGKDPVLFAYPYGDFNANVQAAAAANGIKYSFKVGTPDNGAHAMGRHYVQMGTTLAQIAGWIGGPAPEPETPSGATVLDLGFEDNNVGGWAPLSWGGSGAVAITEEQASAGTHSLKFSGRTTKDASPAINIFSLLQQGRTYDISMKIRLGSGTDKVHVTSKIGETFSWIMGEQDVTSTAWVSFNNTGYTLPSGATELLLYVETAASTADIYIDEVLIKDTTPTVTTNVLNQGFEEGNVGGWAPLSWGGSGAVAITDEQASAGTHSLKFSGRDTKDASPAINIFSLLQQGHTYDMSMKIRLGSGTDKVHVTSKIGETFDWIMSEKDVTDTDWVSFSKTGYTLPAGAADLLLYVETAASTADIYVDEFVITDVTPGQQEPEPTRDPALPFNTITFEDQTAGGFEGRAGTETLTVTNEANHTTNGSYALKVEGRTTSWHGPSMRVEKYVDKGYEYKVSMWVKLISPESSQLQLSTQVGDGSSASYNNILGKTISTDDGWVLYEGNYRYTSVGGEFLTIYIESSSNATASFYIDDISFVRGAAPTSVQTDLAPIKNVYQNDFLIGNAVSAADLEGTRLELLKLHHNVVTAENAMKPDATQAVKGTFTYADSLVDKAVAEGMKVHGHVLVWHQQTPAWMHTANDALLSREEALTNMRTHIRTVMEHYGNKVISWDVVNEAVNDNPPNPSDYQASLRRSAWFNSIGDDFVKQAFLAAREVLDDHPEWNIKLYYNDYNEDNQNKAQAIYSMVKAINDEYALTNPGKLLIDGIGMQAHYNLNTNPENVKLSLEKFISLGVEVSVTELDIQAGSNSQQNEQQATAQGYLYAQLFKLYKEHADKIARVTFWGLNDTTSWRAESSPLVFDRNLQAKPAYHGVIDPAKFMADHVPDTSEALQSTAKYGTPAVDGNVDAVWSQAAALPVNRYQMAWQGASGVAKALWDDQNLYVLVEVSDTQLNKANAQEWEQDSVEVFLDQNNAKTSFYQADDGQHRVNFDNETSFGSTGFSEGFASATKVNGTSYTVEMKLPLNKITAANNGKIGFDVQINDAKDGARQSVAAWNDTTGTGYMDTSVYGILTLTDKPVPTNPGPVPGSNTNTDSDTGTVDNDDGVVTIKPEVKAENGRAIGTISNDNLQKALEQATPTANGMKQIVVEVPKQANAESYEVQLPAASLKGQETFELVMKTDNATLQIPSNMLSNVTAKTEQVSIRVEKASTDSLDAATRERIGSRPVIDLNVVAGGNVVAWNNPKAPVTVAIPYTPSADELSKPDHIVIWYIDGEGKATPIPNGRYDAATGTVVFQTTHFSTYAVASVFKNFGDLESVVWAQQAIDAMAARDVIKGTDGNSFSPAASIKRADFIALLVRALELQGTGKAEAMFSDVQESDYYYAELAIAKELGIANGYEDNTFKPDSNISRQDMMVLTTRALAAAGKQVAAGGALDAYPDAANVSDYAVASAAALVKAGVVNGKDDKLAPQDLLTRAEAAVILYRVWGL